MRTTITHSQILTMAATQRRIACFTRKKVRRPSRVHIIVSLVLAFYAGNRGLVSHRDTSPIIIFNLINQEIRDKSVLSWNKWCQDDDR